MHLADRRSRHRGRRALARLALAVALLGAAAAGAPTVVAQESDGPVTGDQLFGGYALAARTSGIQLTYDSPGLLPVSPIVQVSVPEADATLSTGPSGYARASLAFPGPLLADLGTVLAVADENVPPLPGYPVRAEAFYPAGPTEAEQQVGGATTMRSSTTETTTTAGARYGGFDAPPVMSVGSVTSWSRSGIEDGQAVTRARSELADVRILGGVVSFDSVVTDLVAVNDGHAGATGGGTTVTGARVLGLAATLDERGLLLDTEQQPPDGLLGELGAGDLADLLGGLGPVTDAADQVLTPLNDLLRQVLDQAIPELNGLLEAAGLTIALYDGEERLEGGIATRSASGLVVDFAYRGPEQEQLRELIDLLPTELRQSLGPLPNPVNLLLETHLVTLALAPASVSTVTSPLFHFEPPEFQPAPLAPVAPPATGGGGSLGEPGFTTPAPDLPAAPGRSGGAAGPVELSTEPLGGIVSSAVPALLVGFVILASLFFAPASSRLADNVLAATGAACPQGLDAPPVDPPRRPPME